MEVHIFDMLRRCFELRRRPTNNHLQLGLVIDVLSVGVAANAVGFIPLLNLVVDESGDFQWISGQWAFAISLAKPRDDGGPLKVLAVPCREWMDGP
jgi:hypothetical protein